MNYATITRGGGADKMQGGTHYAQMFSADISLDAGATHTTDSEVLDCRGCSTVIWTAYGTGAASYSGNVTFNIVGSPDGVHWASEGNTDTVVLTGAAESEAVSDMTDSLNCEAISYLKVTSVVNGDASHAITGCNIIGSLYF